MPNDEHENVVNAHLEVAAKCIPTKQIGKTRVPWEILAVSGDVKIAFRCNRKNPTNIKALKLKKAQNELPSVYLKEQTEYIQNQIDKIRDSVEDRQKKSDLGIAKNYQGITLSSIAAKIYNALWDNTTKIFRSIDVHT